MNVGTGLESVNMGDSFVNAWDVANKVSDLLMVKMDRELCDCAGDMNKYITMNSNDGNNAGSGSTSTGSVFFCSFMDTSKSKCNSNIYSNANDNNSNANDNSSENKKKKSKSKNNSGIDSSSSSSGSSSGSSTSTSNLSDKSKPTIDLSGFLQTTVTRSVLTHQVQGLGLALTLPATTLLLVVDTT